MIYSRIIIVFCNLVVLRFSLLEIVDTKGISYSKYMPNVLRMQIKRSNSLVDWKTLGAGLAMVEWVRFTWDFLAIT